MQAALPVLTGISGMFFGTLIGYYKSRAEFTDRLSAMVTKTDCSECDMRSTVKEVKDELDKGDLSFQSLRKDIAGVSQEISVLAAIIRDRDGRKK
jgi:hypothetical protein